MKESSYIKLFILDSSLYNSSCRSNIPDCVNLGEQNSNLLKPSNSFKPSNKLLFFQN